MPAYNPAKSPLAYPQSFHRALERAIGGQEGLEYRTFIGEVPAGKAALLRKKVASFKASLRNYPAHPLARLLDNIATRVQAFPTGLGTDAVYLCVTPRRAPDSYISQALSRAAGESNER